jgi:hypothetical protein
MKRIASREGINGVPDLDEALMSDGPSPAQLALLIPIVAIILGFGLSMLGMALDFRRKTQALKLYHAERMAAIEKGIELPPLADPPRSRAVEPLSSRHRRSGLILFLLGISIMIPMWQMDLGPVYWWGLVPTAIGLALLVASFLEVNDHKAATRALEERRRPDL